MSSNKVFPLLVSLGSVNEQYIEVLAQKTRDRDIPVYRDSRTGVIFIKDFYVGDEEYQSGRFREVSKANLERALDTERRVSQFRHLYTGKVVRDFGCGHGDFLRAICGDAHSVLGVELEETFCQKLNGEGIPCKPSLDGTDLYDVTFMFHVLEHLPDPLPILQQIRGSSTENGTLVIEVPHARDFLLTQIGSEPYRAFTLWSQHLVLHTRQSLHSTLEAAGYERITIYGVQRYGLPNHLNWMVNGLPGGHREATAQFETPELRAAYESALCRIDATDTLVAVAQ